MKRSSTMSRKIFQHQRSYGSLMMTDAGQFQHITKSLTCHTRSSVTLLSFSQISLSCRYFGLHGARSTGRSTSSCAALTTTTASLLTPQASNTLDTERRVDCRSQWYNMWVRRQIWPRRLRSRRSSRPATGEQ